MKKDYIKKVLMNMRTLENSAQVNYLLGKLDIISEDDLNSKLQKLNINEDNIEKFIEEQINKVYRQQNQTSEFINVNQMFCYGRTGNTLHMHLIPKDLRKTKESFINIIKTNWKIFCADFKRFLEKMILYKICLQFLQYFLIRILQKFIQS